MAEKVKRDLARWGFSFVTHIIAGTPLVVLLLPSLVNAQVSEEPSLVNRQFHLSLGDLNQAKRIAAADLDRAEIPLALTGTASSLSRTARPTTSAATSAADEEAPELSLEVTTVKDATQGTVREVTTSQGTKPLALPPYSIVMGKLIERTDSGARVVGPVVLTVIDDPESPRIIGGVQATGGFIDVYGASAGGGYDLYFSQKMDSDPKIGTCGADHAPSATLEPTQAESAQSALTQSISTPPGSLQSEAARPLARALQSNRPPTLRSTGILEVELAHENDCVYTALRGGATNAALYNIGLLNFVNHLYEEQLGTTVRVVYEHFYEDCAQDPFNNPALVTHALNLDAFRQRFESTVRPTHPYDVAYLTSGRANQFVGSSVVGLGYLSSRCSGYSYATGRSYQSFVAQGVLMAHELGHTLGAQHDSAGCPNGGKVGFVMCPFLNPTMTFSNFSKSNIATSMSSASCITAAQESGANKRPFFDFDGKFDPYPITLFEGAPLTFDLPLYDPNNDLTSVTAAGLPSWLTLSGTRITGFLPVDCNRDLTPYQSTFRIDARDATNFTASGLFAASVSRNPLKSFNESAEVLLFPSQTYHRSFASGVPGSTYIATGLPEGATFDAASATINWQPTPDQYGIEAPILISGAICGQSSFVSRNLRALAGGTTPALKRPALIEVAEGAEYFLPMEWVMGEPGNPSVTFAVEGTLPPSVSIVANHFRIAPPKNTVVTCLTQPTSPPQTGTISFRVRTTNVPTQEFSIATVKAKVIDSYEPFSFQVSPAMRVVTGLPEVRFSYDLVVPSGVTGQVVISPDSPPNARVDTTTREIIWPVDMTGGEVISPGVIAKRITVQFVSCGGVAASRTVTVQALIGSTPTPRPSQTPTASPSPSPSPTPPAIPTSTPTAPPLPSATPTPRNDQRDSTVTWITDTTSLLAKRVAALRDLGSVRGKQRIKAAKAAYSDAFNLSGELCSRLASLDSLGATQLIPVCNATRNSITRMLTRRGNKFVKEKAQAIERVKVIQRSIADGALA